MRQYQHLSKFSKQSIYKVTRCEQLLLVRTDDDPDLETFINHQSPSSHGRCDQLLFVSSEEDSELGSIKLQVGEGRDNLWGKTKKVQILSKSQFEFESFELVISDL